MPSPFPGMDPFIEARGKWEDFHNKLLGDMERYLSQTLPERYTVRLGERSYIENVETEIREMFIEIYEVDPQPRLVTGIDVLLPANKRPGTVGWYQCERKRKVFLEGHANLVEIDLLRSGRRHSMAQPWPESPFYLLTLRKEQAPHCKVWPADFRTPLPAIPIPLAAPDADVPLDLQALINAVYERSRYRRDIDYSLPLRPSPSAVDNEWLQTHLLPSLPQT